MSRPPAADDVPTAREPRPPTPPSRRRSSAARCDPASPVERRTCRHGRGRRRAGEPADCPATPRTARPADVRRRRRRRAAAPWTAAPPQEPRAKRRKAPWWELPALVVLAIGIAMLVKSFVVQPFYIPSDSMEKTLHGCPGCSGDRILVNKPVYDLRDPSPATSSCSTPRRAGARTSRPARRRATRSLRLVRGFGQLVGFVPPDGQVLVKRVIATGGQTVKGDAAGHVMVSSHGPAGPFRTLHEPYVYAPAVRGRQPTGVRAGDRAQGTAVGHGRPPHRLGRLALPLPARRLRARPAT